jgi:hypothetical protein
VTRGYLTARRYISPLKTRSGIAQQSGDAANYVSDTWWALSGPDEDCGFSTIRVVGRISEFLLMAAGSGCSCTPVG